MRYVTRPLSDYDDARRLQDLVYGAYGLTYHRGWMYDADATLELQKRGVVLSHLAFDAETGELAGHLAALRPYFDLPGAPEGASGGCLEIGLSIVHPEHRSRGVQGTLALSMYMHMQAEHPDLDGFFMKCVTQHTRSQRSAARFGAAASSVFLGGVPSWVVCNDGHGTPGQPMTTVLMYMRSATASPSRVQVPAAHEALLRSVYEAANLTRDVEPVALALPARGETQLHTWFDPSRKQGVVRVGAVGADVVDSVSERALWMIRGHMKHVTVLLPLDGGAAAAAVPALEEAGLCVGGVIPALYGTDTLVLQFLDAPDLETSVIRVEPGHSERLLDAVVQSWRNAGSQRTSTIRAVG